MDVGTHDCGGGRELGKAAPPSMYALLKTVAGWPPRWMPPRTRWGFGAEDEGLQLDYPACMPWPLSACGYCGQQLAGQGRQHTTVAQLHNICMVVPVSARGAALRPCCVHGGPSNQ